ncbi:MAG: FKBP-type peptidyl-prolyl cis-trans isomerase [Deltaproteobacteria bacterium]|nr:FKBP-type peptidyl-prolyl cis-trans isomerase [Deltaproteobacteria bacterium]
MRTPISTALALAALLALTPTPTPAADPAPSASPAGSMVTTKSGLEYVETSAGEGATPKNGQTVVVLYAITADGKTIEGKNGGRTFEFTLGKNQALKGLEEGVSTMKVGGKRTLHVPPALGYGAEGVPGRVPPHAILQIDVELKAIR